MITFNNIVERFKIFADAHFFVKSFSFGSPDDVDLSKFTSFPLMHLVYTGATYDAGTKTYNLEVYILDVPADKTKKTDRQKEVVSDAEQCAEDIIADIKNGGNIFLFAQDYEVVNATTTPLEEETKNVLSGVLLDLSVAIPYEWDACNAPIDGVSPEGGDEVAYARRGILRMLTQDGSTDVLSVRTIKVTNGTLTDDGDGVVTLDTGGVDTLGALNDVDVSGVTNGQVIAYNNGVWENADDAGGPDVLDDLSDVDAGSPSAGQLLSYGQGQWTTIEQDELTLPIGSVSGLQTELNTIPDNINDLDDVKIVGTPSEGDALVYQSGFWSRGTAGASTLDELDDVQVPTPSSGAVLQYNGAYWAASALSIPSVPSTYYHQRYSSEAATLRSGATETVELYYTAQADGDGLSESASSDTPTSGYDIRRKLYYAEKAFADPDTSGDWTQFTAIADNTTFANAKGALLAYLKERTGGTVPISLKMTWEEVAQAPAFTGLLNESYGSGAAAAYSTRRLNGNYTGAAIEVERIGDPNTQDIGFDNGDLDESALTTFCTGYTCRVRTWYDQSGNGNNAIQTDSTKRPTIFTGGAIVKENGRVALDFNGANNFFNTSWSAGNISAFTAFNIASPTNNTTASQLYDLRDGNDDGLRLIMFSDSNLFYSADATDLRTTPYVSGQRLVYSNYASSTIDTAIDGGTADTTSAPASTSVTANATLFRDGVGNTFYFNGKAQEAIFYASDKSSVRTSIESNIGDYFTQNTPLLDTYSGAAAAYSLRLLDSTYTGALINVWNGTSYADIGANVFGELDTVALAAHCGSNDGFIRYWYDQSGNSNDATQTTTGQMPKIYDGITGVELDGAKPCITFDGSNDGMSFDSSGMDIGSLSSLCVGKYNVLDSKVLFGISGSTGDKRWYAPFADTSSFRFGYADNSSAATTTGDTDKHLFTMMAGSVLGNMQSWIDGATVGTATLVTGIDPVNGIGNFNGSFNANCNVQEVVIYNSDQSSNRTNIEDNINTFYSIY